jgi:hypothetical protein
LQSSQHRTRSRDCWIRCGITTSALDLFSRPAVWVSNEGGYWAVSAWNVRRLAHARRGFSSP